MSRFTIRTPSTSKPSSVRVPVLSKQITSNFPPTFTLKQVLAEVTENEKKKKKPRFPHLCGLMQNILCFFSRERAKFVPMVSVAGNAGGTTMVIKSRALTIIRRQESYKTKVLAK